MDDDSSDNTHYKEIAKERDLAIKRGDNESVLDTSRNKTVMNHDNNFDVNELTCLMPHYSTNLNIGNY